jgi:hypothetical protein
MAGIEDALHQIGASGDGALPPMRLELDLVGLAEAAENLGIGRAALAERRRRHKSFPLPVAELRCGPIWLRAQIKHYQMVEARLGRRGWYGRRIRW